MTNDFTFVAYYCVSTERQGQSGLGLDAQRAAVAAFMKGKGELEGEFVEVESGRKNDRPQLVSALALCRRKPGPVLLIAKLDRLARSVAFISNLMESNVAFLAVDMPYANKLTVHILAAVAEHEREMIGQRTRVALAAAKTRGIKLGNPRPDMAKAGAVASANAARFRFGVKPTVQSLRAEGRSYREIAAELNTRGIVSARGYTWSAATVRAILLRKSDNPTDPHHEQGKGHTNSDCGSMCVLPR